VTKWLLKVSSETLAKWPMSSLCGHILREITIQRAFMQADAAHVSNLSGVECCAGRIG